MKTLRVITYLMVLLFLNSCKEGADEFKSWAKDKSHEYFESVVRTEISARLKAAFTGELQEVEESFRRIDEQSKPSVVAAVSALEKIKPNPIENARNIWKTYLNHGLILLKYSKDVDLLVQKISSIYNVCEEVNTKFIPEPVDLLAMLGTAGEHYYYVGITIGEGGSVEPNKKDMIEQFVSYMENVITGSSEDLEKGMADIKARIPTKDRRGEIFRETCIPVREEILGNNFSKTVELATSSLQSRLKRVSYGLALAGAATYWSVTRSIFESHPLYIDEAMSFMQTAMKGMDQRRDIENSCDLLLTSVSHLHVYLANHDCKNAVTVAHGTQTLAQSIQSKLDGLDSTLKQKSYVINAHERLNYWQNEFKQLLATPEAKACGI